MVIRYLPNPRRTLRRYAADLLEDITRQQVPRRFFVALARNACASARAKSSNGNLVGNILIISIECPQVIQIRKDTAAPELVDGGPCHAIRIIGVGHDVAQTH